MSYYLGRLIDNATYFTGLQAAASIPGSIVKSSNQRQLERILGEFERDHVIPRYEEKQQRMKKELVQCIVEKFLHPHLREYRSDIYYVGGSYEHTNIESSSDFDLQICLRMPTIRFYNLLSSLPSVEMRRPGWAEIKGGPANLLNEDGHMSTSKVRNLLISEVDRYLNANCVIKFKGKEVTIRRSYSGPAVILNVQWSDVNISIDLVPCIKAEDMNGSNGADVVAKSDREEGYRDQDARLWRVSYSRQEKERCVYLNGYFKQMLTLLKVFKVLRKRNSQLRQFPSFFYKHVIFTLADGGTLLRKHCLPHRFKDMIKIIQMALESGNFPNYFCHKINILEGYSRSSMQQTAQNLKRVIDKNEFHTLLQ